MSFWSRHFILLLFFILQTIDSHIIKHPSNVQQINENTFVSNIGVLTVKENENESSHRQLISSITCSSPPYSSSCTTSNPNNCPCTALTDTERQQILDGHNKRRDSAASGNEICADSNGAATRKCPSATNMNYLFWDDGLEKIATYWAHQCLWEHHNDEIPGEQATMYQTQCDADNCLAVGYNGNWIGENLAASGTSGTPRWSINDALRGIERWYNESTLYYWDGRQSFGVTGHWTQGVWATSRYIGCGYASCDINSPFSGSVTKWFNFACKYYPGGNYPTDPYDAGSKCSSCDPDRNGCQSSPISNDKSLCGGGQCTACAVTIDYNTNYCVYNDSSCPSEMLCEDGIGRTMNCGAIPSELWDNASEQALVAGVVGCFFTLIVVLSAIGFIIWNVIKKNGNSDIEVSKSSSMVMTRSGNRLLGFILIAFILFLFPPISFAFIKSNIVLGEEYDPYNSCKIGWFLEYFGYEIGKMMIGVFLIYRAYSGFDNTMYHIPKQHIMHIIFKFIPFLVLMYIILILMGFLLNDQFGVIVTINLFHLYCGYDRVSAVFVFGHIISFIREIGFDFIILYWFIFRLYDMNKNAKNIKNEGHFTKKDIKKMEKKEKKIKEETEKVTKKTDLNIIWNGYIDEYGEKPNNVTQIQQFAKSDKNKHENCKKLTYKEAKQIFDENKGKEIIDGDHETDKNKEEEMEEEENENQDKTKKDDDNDDNDDNDDENKKDTKKKNKITIGIEEGEKDEIKKKKKLSKDSHFNMQKRRGMIIRYVIFIIIMFLSSFITQILLCIIKYPSFYISWDIIIECICCIGLLWISQPIWNKIVLKTHKICLCNFFCPVLIKQSK